MKLEPLIARNLCEDVALCENLLKEFEKFKSLELHVGQQEVRVSIDGYLGERIAQVLKEVAAERLNLARQALEEPTIAK